VKQAYRILKDVFGYDSFRSLQEVVLQHILAKKDTLVIMPTGGGKSLCYQIPALIFNGLTIVISPLISLMKDQVEQLNELGVPAVVLNSTLSREEYRSNVAMLRRNEVKLLYLAPEALLRPWMLDMLSSLPVDVECLTIDEAHCISEWGHDFRPEYRQIADVRSRFPKAVCIALTATATPQVREDIKNSLNFDQSSQFIDSFDRPNLKLHIVPKQNPTQQVIKLLKSFPNQSGIIYCFSRKQVDELSHYLVSNGFSARAYHAGLPEKMRKENQEAFIRDDVQIIVATIAFGMGINKSNIRFVVHFDLPKNIESYYQEIGRAGRDGVNANCYLLFGYGDIQKIKYFIDQKEENEQRIANIHLNALLRMAEADICRRVPLLDYFGEQYQKDNCGMCDNCTIDKKDLVDITIPAQKFLSCIRKTRQMFGANHIIDILRGSKSQRIFKFNHNELSTYGIGTDLSKNQWYRLSRQFIQKGILIQDQEYGSLKITEKGYEVLRGQETIAGMLQEEATKEAPAKKRRIEIDPSMAYDQDLFERLRQKRKELANRFHLPPYVIFTDKALIHMAADIPRTLQEFLDIHGVGQAKMKKYGKIFLDVIDQYCHEKNVPKTNSTKPVPHDDNSFLSSSENVEEPSVGKMFHRVGEACNGGCSITELMRMFKVKQETIVANLMKYLNAGYRLRSDGILIISTLSPEQQAQVMDLFLQLGADMLAPVYNELNGQIDYPQLRIMQLYYLSCAS
jgi:ATP-dependent DNA helicase RecQ